MTETTAVVYEEGTLLASTNLSNPVSVESMAAIANVDITTNGQLNGSVLVYNTATNKWTATRTLDAQDVTGGQY